jgi:hypothetical protein
MWQFKNTLMHLIVDIYLLYALDHIYGYAYIMCHA